MKTCSIVIGSLWGDEGKGHMTDILCSKCENTLNVRFNGGAQASHTVVTPDGKRHSFRHFGSGSFLNVPTYLTEHFIVNPIAFVLEKKELFEGFNLNPIEFVNPDAIVTTPWDMYINQAVEIVRGKNRHGSCGYGINETVERSKNPEYKIAVKDLYQSSKLPEKLLLIKNKYVRERLKSEYNLTIEELPSEYQKRLLDEEEVDMFIFYIEEFLNGVTIFDDDIFEKFENVVFEGAQGLLLDQNNVEYFPNVTTSNTGIKNVMDIISSLNFEGTLDIYYMSRCYITRHGAGRFDSEINSLPYAKVEDLTNVPNKFQGALRFGYLDFDLLSKEINKDLENLNCKASVNITFTCFDQLDETVKFYEEGKLKSTGKKDFLNRVNGILNKKIKILDNIYLTCGLTRDHFFLHKKQ